jgi:pyruvate/2-oxoglutarate dehydrogenase complex dihydrolipoamide acyltransferase (E2) component
VSFRRSLVVDAGYLSHNRHVIHGLVEVDVTRGHDLLREMAARSPATKPSFTAFLVASYARAIAADPSVQALRAPRNRVVVFRNVDVVTMIEPGEGAVAIPHVIRNANLKSVMDITKEIRAIQSNPTASHQQGGAIDVAARMPRWTRMLAYRWFRASPHRFKEMQGTAMLTSVGMFGRGGRPDGASSSSSSGARGGFAIGFLTVHTVGMTVGGIARRPVLADDCRIENRELLSLTLSFDHDLVDGAPAARFTSRLVNMLESATALDQPDQTIADEDTATLDTLKL